MALSTCTKCGEQPIGCGCESPYTTAPACLPVDPCSNPEPCSEFFDAECIIYSGDTIWCGSDQVVLKNDRLGTSIVNIVTYFCTQIATINSSLTTINLTLVSLQNQINAIGTTYIGEDVICGVTVLITEGDTYSVALKSVSDYFCSRVKAADDCCAENAATIAEVSAYADTLVQTVSGLNTDNTDPRNPIVRVSVDGVTVTGAGTPGDPLVASGGGGISGSGENNYVARWTPNDTTLGKGVIRDDGTTASIGIAPNASASLYISSSSNHGITSTTTGPGYSGGTFASSGLTPTAANIAVRGQAYGSDAINIGAEFKADVTAATDNIGIRVNVDNATNNHALELSDGSEAAGRFLKCIDSNGRANWADLPASSGGGMTWNTITGVNPTATLVPNNGYVIRDTNGGSTTNLTLPLSGVSIGDEIKIIATLKGSAGSLQTWRILEGNGADIIFADVWDALAGNNVSISKTTSPLWIFNNTPDGTWSNQRACTVLLTCVQDLSPGYAWSIEFPNNGRS